jgi:hypothetical protein
MTTENQEEYPVRRTCCPCGHDHSAGGISRRGFLQGVGGAAAMGVALTGLTWSGVSAAEQEDNGDVKRRNGAGAHGAASRQSRMPNRKSLVFSVSFVSLIIRRTFR